MWEAVEATKAVKRVGEYGRGVGLVPNPHSRRACSSSQETCRASGEGIGRARAASSALGSWIYVARSYTQVRPTGLALVACSARFAAILIGQKLHNCRHDRPSPRLWKAVIYAWGEIVCGGAPISTRCQPRVPTLVFSPSPLLAPRSMTGLFLSFI